METYCGAGKPYKNIVILFDEFGKYLEFAIGKPYIAGTSALQELFEAVQTCNTSVCFVGFIQFELKAYLQRLNAEYRNEAQRYITRYDNAEKVYLSTNLETLIANLIEKTDRDFIERHLAAITEKTTETAQYYLRHFFPASHNSAAWRDPALFTRVICRGCWPLSPFALWFIYSLAAGSRFLQGRSALSLLKELFTSLADTPADSLPRGGIPATALLTSSLREELISSEKSGNQGAIANALASVLNRHRDRLTKASVAILRAIVIAAKLIMKADNREDAVNGLSWLCGLAPDVIQKELHNLQFELNLVEWDESLCYFDILGDAIPKTQFINFLHQRRLNEYDDHRQARLFASGIDKITDKLTADIETDFGELRAIKTREWRFSPQKTHINFIGPVLNETLATWLRRTGYDEAKGNLVFCYAGHDIALEEATNQLRKELRTALKQQDLQSAPVFIILLHDVENQLGTILAEYDILQNLSKTEKDKFANLVSSHEETLRKHAEKIVHQLIKRRNWITPLQNELPQRLPSVGRALFEHIYKEALPFSMDGFSTAHGNGPTTAYAFARRLFHNRLAYDDIQAMNAKDKNRAVAVFKTDWNIFSSSGAIQKHPAPLQRIFRRWDAACREGLSVSAMYAALLRPPFGMNDLAALLLLGVYLAARHSALHIHDGENALSVREWAETVLPEKRKKLRRNSLEPPAFSWLRKRLPNGQYFLRNGTRVHPITNCVNSLGVRLRSRSGAPSRLLRMLSCIMSCNRKVNVRTRSGTSSQNWKTRRKNSLKQLKERKERIFIFTAPPILANCFQKLKPRPNAGHRNMPQNSNSVLDGCAKTSRRHFPTGLKLLPPERAPLIRFSPSRNRWKNSEASFSQFILKMKRTS